MLKALLFKDTWSGRRLSTNFILMKKYAFISASKPHLACLKSVCTRTQHPEYETLQTRREMSYHRNEGLQNIPFAAPVMFHGLAVNDAREDALRLRTSFFDTAYFDQVQDQIFYRRLSYLPLHRPISVCEYTFEPAFIRKRNERERHRVRCVNEGYARLREHLPHEFEDKRLSKVETLRAAIDYIKHLQSLLELKTGMIAPAQTDREDGVRKTNERKN